MVSNELMLQYWGRWKGSIDCSYTRKTWSADELRVQTDLLASRLHAAGCREGDVIASVLSNTAAFPIALFAALKIGANSLLLHGSTPYVELCRICRQVRTAKAIHDFGSETSRIRKDEVNSTVVYPCPPVHLEVIHLPPSEADRAFEFSGYSTVLHQTSGTGGNPRICVRNQEVAVAEAVNYVSSIPSFENGRVRIATPLNHAFAYGFGLISALVGNNELVLDSAFNPKRLLEQEALRSSDFLALVPPMLPSLIHLKQVRSQYRLSQKVYTAGTRCDSDLLRRFEATFGARLFSILGTTETGAISNTNMNGERLPGVGKVLQNVQVKLSNLEKYADIGEQIGEIQVRSTSMMQGYLGQDSHPIDYFPTGDIGYFDTNDCLHVVGRITDVINTEGIKVDPAEIESVIHSYQGILDCVVYPGATDAGDETVTAAIAVDSSAFNPEALRAYCHRNLSSYKVPRAFFILESIPRTPSGKCLKFRLPNYLDSRRGLEGS